MSVRWQCENKSGKLTNKFKRELIAHQTGRSLKAYKSQRRQRSNSVENKGMGKVMKWKITGPLGGQWNREVKCSKLYFFLTNSD